MRALKVQAGTEGWNIPLHASPPKKFTHPQCKQFYTVPTSLSPSLPRQHQVETRVDFHDLSTSWLEPGECKNLSFTRLITGLQFLLWVKRAHKLGSHNTPAANSLYSRQFRWQSFQLKETEQAVSLGDASALPSEDVHLKSWPQH
jgi:hypothetical protein